MFSSSGICVTHLGRLHKQEKNRNKTLIRLQHITCVLPSIDCHNSVQEAHLKKSNTNNTKSSCRFKRSQDPPELGTKPPP